MKRTTLLFTLVAVTIFLTGCAKIAVKDPVYLLPGLDEPASSVAAYSHQPKFGNGDIVRHRMVADMQGIVIKSDYRYLEDLRTWYYVVDFYPSSALIHFDFSAFDNYERRYVYEFELQLLQKYNNHHSYQNINRWISNF